MKKIWLNRASVEDISTVLYKFPEVQRFLLEESDSSGIGTCINLIFDTEIKNIKCKVIIPITDETTW